MLVGEWIGGCEVWVVVCVGCGASGLRKVGLKRGVAVGMGELQRGEVCAGGASGTPIGYWYVAAVARLWRERT